MTIEYIRYRVPDDPAAFEAAYARAAGFLDRAPQCIDYELSRCTDEPAAYTLRITWTSADDHTKGFRGGDLFPGFLAEIRPYVEAIEEMRHYEPTTVRGIGHAVPSLFEWAGGTEAFDRLTERFYDKVTIDNVVGLPDDPEFRAAFVGYIEWGTRLALANSQPDASPPREAPVPHWGWGVAPPYLG